MHLSGTIFHTSNLHHHAQKQANSFYKKLLVFKTIRKKTSGREVEKENRVEKNVTQNDMPMPYLRQSKQSLQQ